MIHTSVLKYICYGVISIKERGYVIEIYVRAVVILYHLETL
jgi:hypothetical protein